MDAALEAELPEAQRLALAYAPRQAHRPTLALLALDTRLANIVRRGGEPLLAQMRLAWWRDRLSEPAQTWPGGEPVLAALAEWDDPAALAALVEGWEHLLGERLDLEAIEGFAGGRQVAFAALAGQLGVGAEPSFAAAARRWALADLAANLSDPAERAEVVRAAARASRGRLPPGMRPLAVLASLGDRALARGGRPLLEGRGAALVALRVGLLGR